MEIKFTPNPEIFGDRPVVRSRDQVEGTGSMLDMLKKNKQPEKAEKTEKWPYFILRGTVLALPPVLILIPLTLALRNIPSLLYPMFNTLPSSQHHLLILIFVTLVTCAVYSILTTDARVLGPGLTSRNTLGLMALGANGATVLVREVADRMGRSLGPRWGPLATLVVFQGAILGGGVGLALVSFDVISPAPKPRSKEQHGINLATYMIRSFAYASLIFLGTRFWDQWYEAGRPGSNITSESILLGLSVLFTLMSIISPAPVSPALAVTKAQRRKDPAVQAQYKAVSRTFYRMSGYIFPVLLVLRLPLLVVSLRRDMFQLPHPPYYAANKELLVLSSELGAFGNRVVVADNLKEGYRVLRSDHSLLGGRWVRRVSQTDGESRVDLGDSIFATFALQEVSRLAVRNTIEDAPWHAAYDAVDWDGPAQASASPKKASDQQKESALVIGLGVGIAASSFARLGLDVTVVEIELAVHRAASTFFDLPSTPVYLTDGAEYVQSQATARRNGSIAASKPKWDYVIQDCFSGGSVPGELFTVEFWRDVQDIMKPDGIVAVNFAGLAESKASKAVLVTLYSAFSQCRAFGDEFAGSQPTDELTNMVIFCTMAHSPLLSFRQSTFADEMRSPLRRHVFTTYNAFEMDMEKLILDSEWKDRKFTLRRGQSQLDQWQLESSYATWRAMQKILSPAMWKAY